MRRVAFLAASILTIAPVEAADWLALRTDHHQVAGIVSAKELKDVALRLEQFREVIETLNQATVRAAGDTTVVVLAFPDDRSYRPFLPVVNGRTVPFAGMFATGMGGPYITLNLGGWSGGYRGVYHEFSHFLLRGVFGSAPLWFNEGLAEYYSTFEVTGDGRRAIIGKLIAQHVQLLRERRLPLSRLLSITAAAPEYTQDTPDRQVLYAQSWALVHHALHGKPQRRDAIVALALKLAGGATPEQAVLDAYGMTLPELEREVQAYIRREAYSATSFELKKSVVTTLRADIGPADPIEVEAWLGGVLASIGRHDEAAVRLAKVRAARPDLLNAMSRPTYQVQITGRQARQDAARLGDPPEAPPPAPRPNAAARTPAESPPPPPRNGGLILNLRKVGPGERRIVGTLQAIECHRDGVVIVVRTPEGVMRATAASLAAINFVTFRSQAAGSITCGLQTEVPALLTSRADAARMIAVALELLPDGYLP